MLHGDEAGLNSEDVDQSQTVWTRTTRWECAALGFLSTSGSKRKGPIDMQGDVSGTR